MGRYLHTQIIYLRRTTLLTIYKIIASTRDLYIYKVYRSLLAPAADTGFPDMNYEELSRDGMKCQNKYLFESQKKLDVQLL